MSETQGKKQGKRNIERVEIKGNPYNFIAKYNMSEIEDKIIKFLYEMRVATTSLIIRNFSELNERTIRRHLNELYKNHFVFRKFPQKNSLGSAEAYYFLDRIGAHYLVNELKKNSLKELGWLEQDNAIGPESLNHTLAITDIRVAMQVKSEPNEVKLRRFAGEKLVGRIKFTKDESTLEINPDAEIYVSHKSKLRLYFLEYDEGTEAKQIIDEKVTKYEAFYTSKEFKEDYPAAPIILVVANDSIRLHRLKTWIQNKRKIQEIKYYFASLDDVLESPYGEIYVEFKDDVKISLLRS